MKIDVRPAGDADVPAVASILEEVDAWVRERDALPMWELDEINPARIAREVREGGYAVAWAGGEAAGTVKFKLQDPEFLAARAMDNAAYIHRLAVRRRFAGQGVSQALMAWAAERARTLGRDVLRLDCDAHRASLRAVYERFGFMYRDDRQVGPYLVARYELALGSDPGSDPK
jgi:GNAT superfamily N-acetyltransferase